MKKLSYEMALNASKKELRNVLSENPNYKHFKVGKTTLSLDQRFGDNYDGKYDDIELLFDGGQKGELIDWLEKAMIDYSLKTYGEKVCDNRQDGGGPDCADHTSDDNTAKLYVVWR